MSSSNYEPLLQDGAGFEDPLYERPPTHSGPLRPPTYYGEGPFDPPSSEDEDETLLQKEPSRSLGVMERAGYAEPDVKKRSSSLRYLLISLGALVAISIIIGIVSAFTYSGTVTFNGKLKATLDHIANGTFRPEVQSLLWVPEAGDGVFATMDSDGTIQLVDLKFNSTTVLVKLNDIKDGNGNVLWISDWKISSDMKLLLLKTNHLKQWRHSSFGNYWIHDIEAKRTWPMIPPSQPPTTAYAVWSPTGQSIAYVANNDIYVIPSAATVSESPIRVTSNGNTSLFNGVPDWVYEEEVFSADFALWWSPDSTKIAFLHLDETLVEEYTYPIYNPTEESDAVVPYPGHVTMKYPKPGYHNPIVSVHVFELDRYRDAVLQGDDDAEEYTIELEWTEKYSDENRIVFEVVWVGDMELIVKEVHRAGEDGHVVYFDLAADNLDARINGKVVRRLGMDGEEGDDGWIEPTQNVLPIPKELSHTGNTGYLDIVPTPEGYNHVALFSPVDSSTPRFLTTGDWEVSVADGILGVDPVRGLIYFRAASPTSIERNIYSVRVPIDAHSAAVERPNAVTDTSVPSYYSASFSPNAGFYLLSYEGPGVPYQKLIKTGDETSAQLLVSNAALNKTVQMYESPTVVHSMIEIEGYELNAVELRPPSMDESGKTKYPVLFHLYNGPGAQQVNLRFNRDWNSILPTNHKYIVVIVDARGTGFKGRKLRNPVKNNLGFFETRDQINAARIWAGKHYVDKKRIGIWGWSYGGFMSSKVVEANAGVHSLAMAVAPVTSWRLYDSIYTERYMNLPDVNPGGYVNASISNVTGFHNVNYLLAHGSGDDNVHFSNSAHLLDMLTREKVRNFRFRMFTDSDHGIRTRGANREVYQFMEDFLVEKWGHVKWVPTIQER